MERVTIRGRDRIADRSRDCRATEDHKAAGTKNDQPTAHPCVEDRERVEDQQGVFGSVPAKRNGVMTCEKEAANTASFPCV